jgi:hypothetical protein
LSFTHPIGRLKARFFSTLGYSAERWEELADDFRRQHLPRHAEPELPAVHGQKFTIRAVLIGPNEQSAVIVSVWFIPAGMHVPRFVTAYPGGDA